VENLRRQQGSLAVKQTNHYHLGQWAAKPDFYKQTERSLDLLMGIWNTADAPG